jgi:hypothetical protein
LYARVTPTDVQLAAAYYPLLVEVAERQEVVTYGESVDLAKVRYVNRPEVRNAIAVSAGRRLDVVKMFTSGKGLPDLTSLVVNRGSRKCGSGFTRHFDPAAARKVVFEFSWGEVREQFEGFVAQTQKVIAPRKRRKEDAAGSLLWSYSREHSASLSPSIRDHKALILELLQEGFDVELAFAEAAKLCNAGRVENSSDV